MNDRFSQILLKQPNIKSFVSAYLGLPLEYRKSIFSNRQLIKRGTVFYRVRKEDHESDFYNPDAWEAPPNIFQKDGRFYLKDDRILYLGSDTLALEAEMRMNIGEEYWLGIYEAVSDFYVANMLTTNNLVANLLHKIMMSQKVDSLFDEEKRLLSCLDIRDDLLSVASDYLAPLYIDSKLGKGNSIYHYTQRIAEPIFAKNNMGIRYCSCHEPFESSGFATAITLDGEKNGLFALTSLGAKNVRFLKSEKRVCKTNLNLEAFIKTAFDNNRYDVFE